MKPNLDYSLYLIADGLTGNADNVEQSVKKAIDGGCTLVQLREKNASDLEFFRTAERVKTVTDKYGVPLIINDRADVALAVNADGVHLGAGDMPPDAVRNFLGEDKIVGVSARNVEEAIRAEALGADYIGVGAMYATATKADAEIVTFDELRRIKCACSVPIVVIGGINENRVSDFDSIQIDGLCAASAVLSASDIEAAARGLRQAFERRPKVETRFSVGGVRCAVFDLDGTLFDSLGIWEKIDVEFLQARGFEVPSDYIDEVCAMSFEEVAAYTKNRFNLAESPGELIAEWRKTAQTHYSEKIRLKPNAEQYLLTLKAAGIRLGIATNLPKCLYEPALVGNGIADLFECVVSAESTGKGKEGADIYLRAFQKMGVPPEACIVFEDVLSAMRAAKESGAKVCGVYDIYSLANLSKMLEAADFYITDFGRAPLPK